ncbi:NAD-dependent epimerase/dehydratase family protein [Chelativorans xinjiangense]|uniref:NAD-dependent epimerase/dehydratase family protein n=1 Tax=Chelativorans xinjiangense TaxID=2681485 RepID=UPI0013574BF6|nr:NAD-dependent epimerase/dehydratase family protein [Chelativorans xinjiangense]
MTGAKRPSYSERKFGFVEWFRPGEYERTETVLPEIIASGASYLRTHLSWAEYFAPGGPEWFDWLLPRLAEKLDVLPCIHYTPPSISRTGKTSGAPRRLRDYADFVDHVLTRYGHLFRHIELWNEPNNLLDWDWREDTDFQLFCEMIGDAAHWAQERGWSPVLGGPSPFDPYWLDLMGERGVLDRVSAVGFHGFPGTWDSEKGSWGGWDLHIGEMRRIVDRYNKAAEIWITETGYSTWRNDEVEQARRFISALDVPADRMYWYSWRDVPHDVAVQEGLWFDVRHYHLGAVDNSGRPKLLARLLTDGGVEKVAEIARLAAPSIGARTEPVLITGGSGFIGANLADSLLDDGEEVIVLDNLSRPGVDENLGWLKERHGDRVHPFLADVRDYMTIYPAVADAGSIFHLAAQTAVTSSLLQPFDDFEVNGRGTLNVLEAVHQSGRRIPIVFASTNKVYGSLEHLEMIELEDRYMPADRQVHKYGIGEDCRLRFCTPYGCSKGVADQYVLDYATSYGLPAAVLRMSCVYGPRQFGTEDQGWIAHFLIRALENKPITIFGDGKQVRDVLHVSDAVAAYRKVLRDIAELRGEAFNLGGGSANAVSLQVVLQKIAHLKGSKPHVRREDWRAGDQLYFVADTRCLKRRIGWSPKVPWSDGLEDLMAWLRAERVSVPDDRATARRIAR